MGRYSSNLLRGLAALKQDFRILVALSGRGDSGLVPQDPRFEVEALGPAHPVRLEQWALPQLARRWGAQALHFPDNSGPLRPGLPLVLTLHDSMWRRPLGQAVLRPTPRQRLQDAYRKWVCPRAARAASVVLTVSEHSRRDLIATLGLDPAKVRVTSNGLDPAMARPLPAARAAALRKALGLRKPYVLCSGAADRRKNIDRLILAFARARRGPLAQAELVICSLRPGELETTGYAHSARQAGVSDAIRVLGYVDDEQMKALYQGARVYAFPSLWEGFGLPLLEAFSLGAPVLAARAGALPEVAGRAALLADPLSVTDLAEGLSALAGPARARWVAAGRRAALAWQKKAAASAAATLNAYQRAIQAR